MPIAAILTLIANYGPTIAKAIYDTVKTWEAKGEPTEADWQALIALTQKTEAQYYAEARAKAGLPPQ